MIGAIGYTAKEMSERMYHSLRNKIYTLPGDVKVMNFMHAYFIFHIYTYTHTLIKRSVYHFTFEYQSAIS